MSPPPSPSYARRKAATQTALGCSNVRQANTDLAPSVTGSKTSGESRRLPLPPPLPLMLPSMERLNPAPDTAHSTAPLRIGFRPPSRTSTRQSTKAKSKGVAPLDLDPTPSRPTMQTPSRRFRSLTRKAALGDLRLRKSGSTSSTRSAGFCINATPIPPPAVPLTPPSPSSPASPLLTPNFSSASKRLKSKSQKLLRKFSVPVWKFRGSGRLFGGKSSGRSPTTAAPSDEEYHGPSTAEAARNLVSFYQLQSMPCRDFLSSPRYAQGGSLGPGSARTSTYEGDAQDKHRLRKSQSLQDLMLTCAPRMESTGRTYDDGSSDLEASTGKVDREHAGAHEQFPQDRSAGKQLSSPGPKSFINKASQEYCTLHESQNTSSDKVHQTKTVRKHKFSSSFSRETARSPDKDHSSRREAQIESGPGILATYESQTTLPKVLQAKHHPYRNAHEHHDEDDSSDDDPATPMASSPLTSSTPARTHNRQLQSTRTHRHSMLSSVTIQDAFAYDDVGRFTPNILGSPSRASSTLSPTRTSCSRGGNGTVAVGKESQQRSNHSSILSLDTEHSASATRTAQEEERIREQILAACARQEEYMHSFQQEYAKRGASPRSTARGTVADLALAPHRISTVASGSGEALLAIDLLALRPDGGKEEAGSDGTGARQFLQQQNTASLHGGVSRAERQRKTSLGQLFGASQPPMRPARSPRLPPTDRNTSHPSQTWRA